MTNEEWDRLEADYLAACGEPLPHCALEYGLFDIPEDDLARYAKAAIESRKPIDWRDALGSAPLHERDPMIVS